MNSSKGPRAVDPTMGPSKMQGAALSLIPLGVAAALFLLLVPRGTEPMDVPLPVLNERALAVVGEVDEVLAAEGAKGLPADTRALGSRLAEYHAADEALELGHRHAGGGEERTVRIVAERAAAVAADAILEEVARLAQGGDTLHKMLILRSVQLQAFQAELRLLRHTGVLTPAMNRLAGPLLRKCEALGWMRGASQEAVHAGAASVPFVLVPDDREMTVLFKRLWNKEVGLSERLSPDGRPKELQTCEDRAHCDAARGESVPERIALHRLNLRAPHPEKTATERVFAARANAVTSKEKESAEKESALSSDLFLLSKLSSVAADDPTYPTAYARGVALYRTHDYARSVDAFLQYTEANPEGPYALRARHHLAAARRERDR